MAGRRWGVNRSNAVAMLPIFINTPFDLRVMCEAQGKLRERQGKRYLQILKYFKSTSSKDPCYGVSGGGGMQMCAQHGQGRYKIQDMISH